MSSLRLIHTARDRDRDREVMGFYITLCTVHTTQAQGTIVFYCTHRFPARSRAVCISQYIVFFVYVGGFCTYFFAKKKTTNPTHQGFFISTHLQTCENQWMSGFKSTGPQKHVQKP